MTENVNKDIEQQLTNVNILINQLQDYKNKIVVKEYQSDIDEITEGLKDIFLTDPDPFYLDLKKSNLKAILQYVRKPYENELVLVHSSDDSDNKSTINNRSSNLDDIKASFKEFAELADKTKTIQSDTEKKKVGKIMSSFSLFNEKDDENFDNSSENAIFSKQELKDLKLMRSVAMIVNRYFNSEIISGPFYREFWEDYNSYDKLAKLEQGSGNINELINVIEKLKTTA